MSWGPFFEKDAEFIAAAAPSRLAQCGELPRERVQQAFQELGIDTDKADPVRT